MLSIQMSKSVFRLSLRKCINLKSPFTWRELSGMVLATYFNSCAASIRQPLHVIHPFMVFSTRCTRPYQQEVTILVRWFFDVLLLGAKRKPLKPVHLVHRKCLFTALRSSYFGRSKSVHEIERIRISVKENFSFNGLPRVPSL